MTEVAGYRNCISMVNTMSHFYLIINSILVSGVA